MPDDGIKGEVRGPGGGVHAEVRVEWWVVLGLGTVGQGKIGGLDEAIGCFEERHFENAGEFAYIAGPGVLQKPRHGAGRKDHGTKLVAGAEAVKQELCEGGNIFAALAQRRDGEADRGEAESEVGEEHALAGHVTKRCLRGSDDDGATGGTVLEGFENAEEQSLSGRGEQVNAIEVGEAGERRGITVGREPFARITALKARAGKGRTAEQILRQRLLAAAVLAFDGGDLQMRCGHFNLHEELAPRSADADDLESRGCGTHFNERKAGGRGQRLELSRTLHGSQRSSPPNKVWQTDIRFIGESEENMNPGKARISTGAGAMCGRTAGGRWPWSCIQDR